MCNETQTTELVSAADLQRRGGAWLGAARSWLQCHKHNGSDVTWGSQQELRPLMTVKDVEELAAHVAAAVTNECNAKAAAAQSLVVTQEMVDAIVARAKASECGLEDPDKGPNSYDLAQYGSKSLHALAILLVSAHFSKWDIISVMTAALEEVAARCMGKRQA